MRPETTEKHDRLTLTRTGDAIRVTICTSEEPAIDWLSVHMEQASAERTQTAIALAPYLVWSVSPEGVFLWGNDSFLTYAKAYGSARALAEHLDDHLSENETDRPKRIELSSQRLDSRHNRWIEVTTRETEIGRFYFAIGIDAMIRAEAAQQNFVQTLSKTFANLTTGLAIFDRDRRLALFNPALVDLSDVPIEFLSARPAMFEFFDKLRDSRIMPEPKNYDNWREGMAKLVAAASDDRFRETWTLSTGQTFDITGQPYPDGAIAFLFNDITAEVSLTRGFRTELDTMQSVIDTLIDAVAVFSQQGSLTLCNATYAQQWNVEPDACIAETSIVDATQSWKTAFHPSPVWPELRDYVTRTTERVSWDTELRGKDGREVICRIDPISHGATLIRFCHRPPQPGSQTENDALQIVSA
jgi:PAS domain-containing protein